MNGEDKMVENDEYYDEVEEYDGEGDKVRLEQIKLTKQNTCEAARIVNSEDIYQSEVVFSEKVEELSIEELHYKGCLYDILNNKIKDMIRQGTSVRYAFKIDADDIIGNTDWILSKEKSEEECIVLEQKNKWFNSIYVIETNIEGYEYVFTHIIKCPAVYKDDIINTYFKTFCYIIDDGFTELSYNLPECPVEKFDNEGFKYARMIHKADSIHEDVYMMRAEKEQPYNKQMTLLFQYTRKIT